MSRFESRHDVDELCGGEDDLFARGGDGVTGARELCRALLCDGRPSGARFRDPEIAAAVTARLRAVGFRWAVIDGRAYAVAEDDGVVGEDAVAYTEPQLAAIARLAIELVVAPEPHEESRATITVDQFHRSFAPERRWSKAWLRRAVLGPLERDGYINVVAPGQRRSDAFIEAGPRLRMIDARRIARALEEAA